MKLPKSATTKHGMAVMEYDFPAHWPLAVPTMLKHRLADGYLVVKFGSDLN